MPPGSTARTCTCTRPARWWWPSSPPGRQPCIRSAPSPPTRCARSWRPCLADYGLLDHDRLLYLAVDLVIHAGKAADGAGRVVAESAVLERQCAPVEVHDIEDRAAELAGGVVMHDRPGDRDVVLL